MTFRFQSYIISFGENVFPIQSQIQFDFYNKPPTIAPHKELTTLVFLLLNNCIFVEG